jgi:fumarate hydratase subunit beta
MKTMPRLSSPLDARAIRSLTAGQQVLLSGIVYTARDAAHKRLLDCIRQRRPLPLDLSNQTIYYTGPSPAKPGSVIGSAGPTTSSRMDPYAPPLMEKCGVRAMIGKGNRSRAVVDAMKKHSCIYFAATGGAGALLSKSVTNAGIVCYDDLGPEAMYRLEVKNMPLVVAIDCRGNSLFRAIRK